jgi:hypothetical protein
MKTKIIKIMMIVFLIFTLLISSYCKDQKEDKDDEQETETICEREGQTICQAYCSPVSFKKCKKNITSQNYDYCCVCEFHEGEFKSECIPVIPVEY